MKKSKKLEKNLNSRIKGYNDLLVIVSKENRSTKGYHMPGSRSGKK